MLTIIYNRKKCIGCSNCILVSPLYFTISKLDGKSILLNSIYKNGNYIRKSINNINYKYIEKAVKVCPVKIIKLIKY
ncbi:MAG: ferredoxin [Candidatus Shikimatogenerans bostrichidophilus]|nr:MAG: ferredoxin [Candidatus Shikimatogenerans bostrichidophilus]